MVAINGLMSYPLYNSKNFALTCLALLNNMTLEKTKHMISIDKFDIKNAEGLLFTTEFKGVYLEEVMFENLKDKKMEDCFLSKLNLHEFILQVNNQKDQYGDSNYLLVFESEPGKKKSH